MNRKTFLESLTLTAGYISVAANESLAANAASEPEVNGYVPLDWSGCWLGLDWMADARAIGLPPIVFRHDFTLSAPAIEARVLVSASPSYLLWVNNRFINQGPIRAYPVDYFYDELDIRPYLQSGLNHIAVLITAPTGVIGYAVNARQGFILDGIVRTATGTISVSTAPETWRAKRADWYASPDPALEASASALYPIAA